MTRASETTFLRIGNGAREVRWPGLACDALQIWRLAVACKTTVVLHALTPLRMISLRAFVCLFHQEEVAVGMTTGIGIGGVVVAAGPTTDVVVVAVTIVTVMVMEGGHQGPGSARRGMGIEGEEALVALVEVEGSQPRTGLAVPA